MKKVNKILNNTCIEVLPSLLNKSKVRTTRAAFKEIEVSVPSCGMNSSGFITEKRYINKDAKFKVGDKVEMYWDNKSDYTWYKKSDGKPIFMSGGYTEDKIFSKSLGMVEILSVEKIKINTGKGQCTIFSEFGQYSFPELQKFSDEEGFESTAHMFKYFDENFDSTEPKEFWTYTFIWLSKENSNEKIQV